MKSSPSRRLGAGILALLVLVASALADDPVAQRGQELLGRYLDTVYPDPAAPAKAIGANQAYATLLLHRNDAEVKDANEKLAVFLKPYSNGKYWSNAKGDDLSLYWSETMLIKLMLEPQTRARLSPENQHVIKDLMWDFIVGFSDAYTDADFATADPARVGWIHGSDNHDIIRRGFFFFGAQLLKDDPEYAQRLVPGGGTLADFYAKWVTNLKLYFRERAASGLVAEIGSPWYIGVYLQTLFMMADYSVDDEVRALANKFLDLVFADAAQETLHGVRGGARSRAYKTAISYDGRFDALVVPLFVLTGEPSSGVLYPLQPGVTPLRQCFSVFDTKYRLPDAVLELFLERDKMGEFQYDSIRPSTGSFFESYHHRDAYPVYLPEQPSRFVRSTFVTPAYVLGWFTHDESRGTMLAHDQNQWMGAIISADNGRLAITGSPNDPTHRTSYADLQAVGQRHAMIVRRNLKVLGNGPLRVFFSPDFKLAEQGGWLFARSGDDRSWFALRAASVAGGAVKNAALAPAKWGAEIPGDPVTGSFYAIPDLKAFLIVESGSAAEGSYDDFVQEVLKENRLSPSQPDPGLTYHPIGDGEALTLFQTARIPLIGGTPVQLPPAHAYWSPYLQADDAAQVFTVRAPSGKQYAIDFSAGAK